MTIQQFAEQLKQKEGTAPLLQNLQAMRKFSLDQVWAAVEGSDGWIPWGVVPTPQAEPQS
jgi:hypothetical protein